MGVKFRPTGCVCVTSRRWASLWTVAEGEVIKILLEIWGRDFNHVLNLTDSVDVPLRLFLKKLETQNNKISKKIGPKNSEKNFNLEFK